MGGNILKTKGGLVINRPGNVLFIPVKSDGTLDWSNAIRNQAVINTITITNSKTKTEIPDGNSFYPAGDRVTGIAGTVAIDFSTVDIDIWAMSSGTELKNTTDDTMINLYDYQNISEAKTIEVSEKYKTDGFVKVIGADGTVYEKIAIAEPATPPEAGEFTVAVNGEKTTFTFAEADKGKSVAISMAYTVKTQSYSQGRKAMKYHKIIVATDFSSLNDTEQVKANILISQASITGDMVDALQKDPSATKTLTFNMYAPLPGEQPYEVKFEDKTA